MVALIGIHTVTITVALFLKADTFVFITDYKMCQQIYAVFCSV